MWTPSERSSSSRIARSSCCRARAISGWTRSSSSALAIRPRRWSSSLRRLRQIVAFDWMRPRPRAVGAALSEQALEVGAAALAGDLDQAELGDVEHLGLRPVLLDLPLEAGEDLLAVDGLDHVDEVDDDDPAEVAQADLAHDLLDRLEVGLQHRVLEVRLAHEAAGVDVDGDQRLGGVDHDVAPRLQPDLALQGRLDLLLDAELLEQRGLLLAEELDLGDQARLHLVEELDDPLVGLLAVHPEDGEVLAQQVADDSQGEVEVLVEQGGGGDLAGAVADLLPEAREVGEVALELLPPLLLPRGADDQPAAAAVPRGAAGGSRGGARARPRPRSAARRRSGARSAAAPGSGPAG